MEEKTQSLPQENLDEKLFRQNSQTLIVSLASMLKMAQLYDPSNKVFIKPSEELATSLKGFVPMNGMVTLEQTGDEFFIGKKLVKPNIYTANFHEQILDDFKAHKIGGLSFKADISPQELITLLVVYSRFRPKNPDMAYKEFNSFLESKGVRSFYALKPTHRKDEYSLEDAIRRRRQKALMAYQNAVDYVKMAMANLEVETTSEKPGVLDTGNAKRIVQRLVDISNESGKGFVFEGLAAIKNHDEYTYAHVVNVCILTISFGKKLGFSKRDLGDLGMAALFHDFGKINVPLRVLNKQEKFDPEEWQLMKDHSAWGIEMLKDETITNVSGYRRLLTAIQHHQNVNLTGYPDFKLRRRPHIFARIVAITDAYDAMTTNRVYQRALTPDKAMQNLLRMSGTRYDPVLVRAFISSFGVYPIGSLVFLSDGSQAIITEVSPMHELILRPKVKIIVDSAGNEHQNLEKDLAAPENQNIAIIRCLDPELHGVNVTHYLI